VKGAETAKYYTYYKNIDDTNIKAVEVVLNLVDTDETSISVNVYVNDPKYFNLVPTPQEYSLFCAKLEELIEFKGSYTELDFAIEALDFHKYRSERGLVEYRRTSNVTNRIDIIILKVKTEWDFDSYLYAYSRNGDELSDPLAITGDLFDLLNKKRKEMMKNAKG
jgi:hypothetical protein